MKKFLFAGVKAVVVKNVLSVTKRDPDRYGVIEAFSYSIEILYKTGISESVSYKDSVEDRDTDFFCISKMLTNLNNIKGHL